MNSQTEEISSYSISDNQDSHVAKCVEWLQRTSINNDNESISTETSDSSSFHDFSSDADGASGVVECYVGNREVFLNDKTLHQEVESVITQSQNVYTNVKITKSKNVHLGNITYINGPVYVNQTSTVINNQTTINQYLNDDDSKPPYIISRTYWLAQPPTNNYIYLKAPAQFVIISHSASEEGFTQPANVLLVRLIQQFHIESRYFDDIAYNFLVGADGNIYEGRGWNVVGAHTHSYNSKAIGICFIGCFTTKLPTTVAIRKAKRLIAYGVKTGFIDKEYTLLGHSQCSTTESPGSTLFEDLKTWERFDPNISIEKPSPLINI